jgi:hypothetical protein
MDLVLADGGCIGLAVAVTLSYLLVRRWALRLETAPQDEYWMAIRQAEVLTRSTAPFV